LFARRSWFSWRHQLKAVGAAGFRGIAPDMRGYGGTSAPEHFANYSCHTLASDMMALLQHVGHPTCCLVGHDHGAATGWTLANLHPTVFTCYMAMSVPYNPRRADGPPPFDGMRARFGDERDPDSDPGFFYILHHNMPESSAQYSQNSAKVLSMLYGDPKAPGAKPPQITTDRMFVEGEAQGMWTRGPREQARSSWISEEELDYIIGEFDHPENGATGDMRWNGGLNWYRVMDVSWHATPHLAGAKVKQPSTFVAGLDDSVITMGGGLENVKKTLAAFCEQLDEPLFIENAGHWIQQEKAAEVNEAVLGFANRHKALFSANSKL
jgi:pimeloyl-ACP methyl ester carboxylesterase